jgi:hypothetical protein
MNLFSRMAILAATALLALSLPTVIEPAVALDPTLVKGATPQLSQRADHPAAFKTLKKKQPTKSAKKNPAR